MPIQGQSRFPGTMSNPYFQSHMNGCHIHSLALNTVKPTCPSETDGFLGSVLRPEFLSPLCPLHKIYKYHINKLLPAQEWP